MNRELRGQFGIGLVPCRIAFIYFVEEGQRQGTVTDTGCSLINFQLVSGLSVRLH